MKFWGHVACMGDFIHPIKLHSEEAVMRSSLGVIRGETNIKTDLNSI